MSKQKIRMKTNISVENAFKLFLILDLLEVILVTNIQVRAMILTRNKKLGKEESLKD